MASRERSLYLWLRQGLPMGGDLNRVENSACPGTPDVEGCIEGVQLWLELKCADRPAKETTPIRLRWEHGQVPWLQRRWRAGGTAFALVQVGTGHNARRYLVPATSCDELLEPALESRIDCLNVLVYPQCEAVYVLSAARQYRGR